MTIGSLFSGIGGLELGLEWATGARTIWQVEIDPYCRGVLAKHWPEARRYEDVRTIGAEVERPDIICGGFPCQDISNSGTKGGLDGARSGLWYEYERVVGLLRPDFILVENASALAIRGLDRVLLGLARHGYDAEWDCFTACETGAPHTRSRLFLLAYSPSIRYQKPRFHHARGGEAAAPHRKASHAVDDRGWATEPSVGRVAHGTTARMDEPRLRALGNCVVPQIAEKAWRVLYGRAVNHV